MNRVDPFLRRISLPAVTAAAAALLGGFMLLGGTGLLISVIATPQPSQQLVTAGVLMGSGAINLAASRSIARREDWALAAGAVATAAIVLYLTFALRDFGEPLMLHAAYLGLLGVLANRRRFKSQQFA
jgi:hypothetical protein